MRALSMLGFAAVVAFSIACGGGMPTATMVSPWSDMNLPVGSGNVFYSDATSTTINYDGGDKETLAKDYSEAMKTWGCAEKFALQEAAGSWTYTCDKDGKSYTLSVTEGAGMVIVSVATY